MEKAILEGIFETEGIICQEVFRAFKYRFPGAEQACKQCIPYLPLYFPYGELHRVYNKHGQGIFGVYEFGDLLNMLIEIGVIGRVIRETDRYIEGRFEYNAPHHLVVSSDDRLCLHPVFSEVFAAKKPEVGPETRAIYPFGTDIDEPEFRELI